MIGLDKNDPDQQKNNMNDGENTEQINDRVQNTPSQFSTI